MLVSQGADRQKNTWTPIFLGWGLPAIIVLTLVGDLTFIISGHLACLTQGSHPEPTIVHGSLLMTMMLTRLESDMAGHCWFDMADANTLVLALIEVMVKSLFGFKLQIFLI